MPRAEHNPVGRPRDEALAARRRDEILRHAIKHFARSGYANADLDTIAADIGCAKGTLYRYFQSKSELFRESVDLVMRQLLEVTAASESDDPIERLEYGIRAFLAYFDAHPEYVELLIQERAEFRDRSNPTHHEYRSCHAERWKDGLRRAMAQGRMRQMPPQRVLDVVGDLLYGTIFTNYFEGKPRKLEQQCADVLGVLFPGLLTPREATRWLHRMEKGAHG